MKQLVRDYSGTPSPPRSAAQALLTIYDREDHTEGDPPSTRPRLAISDHRLAAGGPVAQLSGFEYVFRPDELAQRVQRTRWRPGPGVSTDYGCNPRGWLTSADADDDGYDEAYGYDGSAEGWDGPGNLAGYDAEKRAYTAAGNRLAEDDEHAYAHDARGNVVRRVWLGDPPWGEPKTRKLVYDAQGHLVELRDEDEWGTPQLRVTYEYDALDRRTARTVTRGCCGGEEVDRHLYVHDGAQVLLELDPDLIGTPGQCNELAGVLNRRAYGPGIDGLLWLDHKVGEDIVRSYPVRDLVGSVWGLVDQGGEVTAAALEYNAWGKPSWEPGTDFGPVRYTGRDWDADEGMYYYRARWYAPELGRFVQADPIGFAGGDLNLFAYVGGDPVTRFDPAGLLGLDGISDGGYWMRRAGSEAAAAAYEQGQGAVGVEVLGTALGGVVGAKALGGLGRMVRRAKKAASRATRPCGGASKGRGKITEEVIPRKAPGADGAKSKHILEKIDGKTNSTTHQVIKDGKVVHQHQTHIGKHGTRRQFPDEWVEHPEIPGGTP